MARINVDDDIEARPEYRKLLRLVGGDDDKALGLLIRFWRLAQKYWGEHKLVPREEVEIWGFEPLIESRWAVIREDGVYAKGSEERFAWYRQKCDAGKKGGRPTKAPVSPGSGPETGEKPEESGEPENGVSVNPPVPVPAPVLVPVKNQEKEEIEIQAYAVMPGGPPTPAAPVPKRSKFSDLTRAKMRSFIDAYAVPYRAKYGGPPECLKDKALIGKLGHWIEHMSSERANAMVQVYMQIDHRRITDEDHSLWLFFRYLNKIGNALNTGKDTSQIDWNQVFAGGAA